MNTPRTDAQIINGKQSLLGLCRQLERELIESQEKVKELREALQNSQAIAIEYAEEMACTPMSGVCRQIEKNYAILEKTK